MPRPKKRTILLVDPDVNYAKIYAKRLEVDGWRMLLTHAVSDAQKRLIRVVPDICILDLPQEDLISLLKILQTDPKMKATRKIVLSMQMNRELLKKLQELGVEAHFLKTQVSPEQIVKYLKTFL